MDLFLYVPRLGTGVDAPFFLLWCMYEHGNWRFVGFEKAGLWKWKVGRGLLSISLYMVVRGFQACIVGRSEEAGHALSYSHP